MSLFRTYRCQERDLCAVARDGDRLACLDSINEFKELAFSFIHTDCCLHHVSPPFRPPFYPEQSGWESFLPLSFFPSSHRIICPMLLSPVKMNASTFKESQRVDPPLFLRLFVVVSFL